VTELDEPRFGPGSLPIDYIPLNSKTLFAGERLGPLAFKVSANSCLHNDAFLEKCGVYKKTKTTGILTPFQMWPLTRVLSRWRYGRINEVISVRAVREILRSAYADEDLTGVVTVKEVIVREGLCFGFFESVTCDSAGNVCMKSQDSILLANGCKPDALRNAVRNIVEKCNNIDVHEKPFVHAWELQMRFEWLPEQWRNNIHTEVYAHSIGYEHALVEGPATVDVVTALDENVNGPSGSYRVKWKYDGPLDVGRNVELYTSPRFENGARDYFVCCESNRDANYSKSLLHVTIGDL
jgi:hypothetical protein